MYKCLNCGAIFDEPEYEQICFEELYGVGGMFPDRHYGTIAYCPKCGSPEVEDYYEEDDDDEIE